jgi:hypothetical protein
MLKSITISKSNLKKATSLIMNSNKLKNTINILDTRIICKLDDLETIENILTRNTIKFR